MWIPCGSAVLQGGVTSIVKPKSFKLVPFGFDDEFGNNLVSIRNDGATWVDRDTDTMCTCRLDSIQAVTHDVHMEIKLGSDHCACLERAY